MLYNHNDVHREQLAAGSYMYQVTSFKGKWSLQQYLCILKLNINNSDEDFDLELVWVFTNLKYFHIYTCIDTTVHVSTCFEWEDFNGECLLSKLFTSCFAIVLNNELWRNYAWHSLCVEILILKLVTCRCQSRNWNLSTSFNICLFSLRMLYSKWM